MKKLALALVLLVTPVFADDWGSDFGDINLSSGGAPGKIVQPIQVPFNTGLPKLRACLTKITVTADNFTAPGFAAGPQFTILDGGTTVYQVGVTTSPITDFWEIHNPLCSTPGATFYMYVSTGAWRINATGFYRPR